MNRPATAALACLALAMGGCSSSEATEAADASELGHRARTTQPTPSAKGESALLDEDLLREVAAEAGFEMTGDPVPCLDPPTRVRPGADWVADSTEAREKVTLMRPPHWVSGDELGGWVVEGAFGPSLAVVPFPMPEVAAGLVDHDLLLGSTASSFVEVEAVERLDDDTCFISGIGPDHKPTAVTVHWPQGREGTLLIGMVLEGAESNDVDDLMTALRLVEFGPS